MTFMPHAVTYTQMIMMPSSKSRYKKRMRSSGVKGVAKCATGVFIHARKCRPIDLEAVATFTAQSLATSGAN